MNNITLSDGYTLNVGETHTFFLEADLTVDGSTVALDKSRTHNYPVEGKILSINGDTLHIEMPVETMDRKYRLITK